jgi:prepilin-type N-terminal cleavage/methylation domain-containing protein
MNKQKGFTLVELLVVIAILGLLVTLLAVSYRESRLKIDCDNGDSSACIELEKNNTMQNKKENKELSCEKDRAYCRHQCVGYSDELNNCLIKCDIEKEYCLSLK